MRKFKFILTIMAVVIFAQVTKATSVTVVSNTESGITDANLTGTLSDGTILGFYSNGSYTYFCGAVSQQSELTIPDSIVYSSTSYAVDHIGCYNGLDFSRAGQVRVLRLPATVTTLTYLSNGIKELHTGGYIASVVSSQLVNLNKVCVPSDDLQRYYDNTAWSTYVLINAEGQEPLKVAIQMTKAGEFAQLLLQQTDNWYKVNELTVVGELNSDDLDVFKRMKQLTKLDLSRAVITDIPDQFGGVTSINNYRDGFCLLEELILPDVNTIGKYAFAQTYRLKTVTLSNVNSISYGAFVYSHLPAIELPSGLRTIGDYAFANSGITEIKIPSTVSAISNSCFSNSLLKSVVIPSSVSSIGQYAFQATKLHTIILPNVSSIGYRAFYDCKQLSSIDFGQNLVSMEGEPFANCTSLTEVDLPATLRSMDSQAFAHCTGIKKVTSRAVVPPTHNGGSSILNGCDKTDVKLYVPKMSVDDYRAESGWKSFYTILPMDANTSFAYIYDHVTISDASEISMDCDMTIDWCYQYRNGSTGYYCGVLEYDANSTMSLHKYKQIHNLGNSSSSNQYSGDSRHTSLIANGSMRADSVLTTLRTVSTDTWYFISLPYDVNVSEITYTEGAQFVIRKYSGLNRANQSGNTWLNLTKDSVMHAYEGYILKCNMQHTDFIFPAINNTNKNKQFESKEAVVPLGEYLSEFEHNRSWNLIGNPYPCYYDIRYMNFTAPITVWNRYYDRYDAYSPIDDAFILHPAQAFFVQCPVDAKNITFNVSGRQSDGTVRQGPAKAKSLGNADVSDRKVYNVILSDGVREDKARFVINNDAKSVYELDKDATKFITDNNSSPLVYTVEGGVKYAINERPLSDGTISLGIYCPTDGKYTLSLNCMENEAVTLMDKVTNKKLSMTTPYTFSADAGYVENRFFIVFSEATRIEHQLNENAEIMVENGFVNCKYAYSIYSMDGILLTKSAAGNATYLSSGTYIINYNNVTHKINVK